MKIHVQFFSRLKDLVQDAEADYDLPEGSTMADLLAQLYACSPQLQGWDSTILVAAGVEFVPRDYILQPDDQISVMPPVQGG